MAKPPRLPQPLLSRNNATRMAHVSPPQPALSGQPSTHFANGGFTWRAAIIGGLLVVFISIWSQYTELVIHGTQISLTYPPIGAFLVFGAFIVLFQWPLQLLRRQLALTTPELVIIWSMLSLAIGVASIDIAQKMPPMIAGTIYYASDQNHYQDLFVPHIALWLTPQDPGVIRGMFEGSAAGVPWKAWLGPLGGWSAFFVLAYWVMLCGVALFQRQWVDHERLLFPLVLVPLKIIEQPRVGEVLNPFFRNKLVWMGIFLGAAPHIYTGLHDYFAKVPQADIFLWGKLLSENTLAKPWTPFNGLRIAVLPLILGLSFLLTREISFSLWFFYLLGKFEAVAGVAMGIDALRTVTSTESFPFPGLQTAGAYIGLAAVSIWVARKGLLNVLRGDDRRYKLKSGLPAQVAVYGGGAGLVGLIIWCMAAGMPLGPTLVMLLMSFVYLLAMTRLVAEAGMPWCAEPDFRGHHMVMSLFPSGSLRVPQLVATGMMLTFSHDLRVSPMPRFMQSFKMTAETGASNRDLIKAFGLALLIALPVSLWALMRASYAHGGVTINTYRFVSLAQAPGKFMESAVLTPRPTIDFVSLGIIAYGAAKLLALNTLRTYYLWWPLHPVGYAMSFVTYLHREWFSVMLGWVVQTVIIRYSGHKGYQAARPLFLGLILGAMAAGGFWLVLDGFTGLRDHKILY
jgi:hypothetical protein